MGTEQITDAVNPFFSSDVAPPPPVFLSVFVAQVWLCCRSFTLSKQEPDHLPSCLRPSKCDVSAAPQAGGRKSDPNRGVPLRRNYLLTLTSIPPSFSPLSLHLSLTPFAVEHNLSAINFS